MIFLAALAVFSGLSLNLLLHFALGTAGAASDPRSDDEIPQKLPFFQFGVLFLSVIFLWVFFSFLSPSWRGFSNYFLAFPFSALVCMGLEFLGERMFAKFRGKKVFSAVTAYDGLAFASLLITLTLASDFTGAVVLALFFVLGNLTAMLTLDEIRRRSALEWVPRHLRGSPLVLVSMGLLSLVSGAAAGICFKMLEVF